MTTRNKSQNKQVNELLPVKNDYVFSRLFGAKNHEHILISLLNSILNGRPHIKSIKLEPTEFRKKTPKGKSVRLDIVATTDDGTIIQVEMQCVNKGNIIDRAIFCQSRLRAEELKEGEDYSSVPDVISIWICDQSVTDRVGCCHEMLVTYQKTNLDPFEPASKKVRYYIIELQKLNKIPQGVVGKNFKIWMC